MNSITFGSGRPDKAGDTDCEANGTCFKPQFWIHDGPRAPLGH